jgi:hypothetical protein
VSGIKFSFAEQKVKRIAVTILALVYLSTSAGASLDIHYCMGKMVSAHLAFSPKQYCSKCGMKIAGGCCKDEFRSLKITDSHQPVFALQHQISERSISRPESIFQVRFFNTGNTVFSKNNSPPNRYPGSLHTLLCVFRI